MAAVKTESEGIICYHCGLTCPDDKIAIADKSIIICANFGGSIPTNASRFGRERSRKAYESISWTPLTRPSKIFEPSRTITTSIPSGDVS